LPPVARLGYLKTMSLFRLLRLPLDALAVAGGARSFADNAVLGSDALNRLGLHAGRVALAERAAELRRALMRGATAEDRATFARDGILVKQGYLPSERFARLRAELLETPLRAREHLQGDALNRLIPLSPTVLTKLPETAALLAAPEWRVLLRHVTSSQTPPILFVQTIFSQAVPAPHDPQTELHSDTFYPSMKAWLYLTDVALEDGPFVYVPGSHRATPARLAWERAKSIGWRESDPLTRRGSMRITASELEALGLPPARPYPVPANTLVIADTHGFHARATSARPSVRVAVFAQGRGSPFIPLPLPSPRALLGGREVDLAWKLTDALATRGWAYQHWQRVGEVRAGDPPVSLEPN